MIERLPFQGTFPITQDFANKLFLTNNQGAQYDYYAQYMVPDGKGNTMPMRGHNGIDFGVPTGTFLYAPHAGTVLEAAYDPGYGYYVKIENEDEGSVMGHMQVLKVKVGFLLKAGDTVGISDNTGSSTGAHLHWGYYKKPRQYGNGYNGYQDQMPDIAKFLNVYVPKITPDKYGVEVRPASDIPTGSEPGRETLSFGRIGKDAPGKITGVAYFNNVAYYQVDQRYFGGGVGWVKAQVLDSAPVYQVKPKKTPTEPTKEEPKAPKNDTPDQKTVIVDKLYLEKLEEEFDAYTTVCEKWGIESASELDQTLTRFINEESPESAKPITINDFKVDTISKKIHISLNANFDYFVKLFGLEPKGGAA